MIPHAGYASVVVVSEYVLNQVLRVYHAAGSIPVHLQHAGSQSFSHPLVGGGTAHSLSYDFDLFMGAPKLSFEFAYSPQIKVDLLFSGPVTLSCTPEPVPGFGFVESTIRFTTEVLISPQLAKVDKGLQIGLDFSTASVTALNVFVNDGPDLVELAEWILSGSDVTDFVLDMFTDWLQDIGPQHAVISPELLNQVGPTPYALDNPTFKVLEGALAVAVDVPNLTEGTASLINDFRGDPSLALAVVVHPNIALDVLEGMRSEIVGNYGGYSIDSADFALGSDYIHIWGEATEQTADVVTVDYSIRARPVLGAGVIEVDVFESDIELPWWAILLGLAVLIFTLGGVGPVTIVVYSAIAVMLGAILSSVEHMVQDMAAANIESRVRESRTQSFDLPDTTTKATLYLEDLQIGDEGQILKSSFTIPQSRVHLSAPNIKDMRTGRVKATMSNPVGFYHPDDPYVQVRFIVDRYDLNGDIIGRIVDQIRPATDPDAFEVYFDFEPYTKYYKVHGTVLQHQVGGNTLPLGGSSGQVDCLDALDKTHRFVRWRHEVPVVPKKRKTPSGKTYYPMAYMKPRISAIHRTAWPGRCEFADQYSERASKEYFDQLPFQPEELEEKRDILCEYCFFGGAGKDELLIDPWSED